nr:NACHT, LRR and PYD domains-containing protein 5-like isoform X1 [Hydra vulgaris]XP_047142605.1 NACHT, LRR and PYD domains-containing protein 5-like isoform X1 [Hydra vulgaris]
MGQHFTYLKKDNSIIHTQEFKLKFSESVGVDWRTLGCWLSIKDNYLDMINQDYTKTNEKAYFMLSKWLQMNKNPTLEELKRALKNMERIDLIRKLDELTKISNSPEITHRFSSKKVSRKKLTYDELISKCCGKISYKIGSDWLLWGRHLGLSDSDLDNIGSDYRKCYEKADYVLIKWKQKNGNPSWEQLKKELIAFKRYDIVVKIEKKFGDYLSDSEKIRYEAMGFDSSEQVRKEFKEKILNSPETANRFPDKKDLSRVSADLKMFYLNHYGKIGELQPPLKKPASVDLDHKFIDLHIVDAENIQIDKLSCEREKFLKKQMSYAPFSYSEIFMKNKSVILISGIAGIGKTWLLRKFLLDWSNGSIWKDVKLVFYLECRKLNQYQYQNISNINELLNVDYKDVINDFNISSHTALFIIDGLDEFIFLNELINPSLSCNYPIVNALAEIQKKKHVIAGRVYAIDEYQNIYTERRDKLIIQIMGFNENGINNYVENNVMEEKKELVKATLKASLIAKAMASIPFYLSSMCQIINNSNEVITVSFSTMTDLYANIFLYFLRSHIFKNDHINKKKSIYQIMEDETNKRYILNICKIAYELLAENKIIFSTKEILNFISDFNKNESKFFGFIERIETDEDCYYQFAHLTLMEFCASVYAYNCLSSEEIANKKLIAIK